MGPPCESAMDRRRDRGSPGPRDPDDGHAARLDTLHRLHSADLLRALRRRFGAGHDGLEDAVQAAFLRFLQLPDHETVGNPRAFLLVMARNLLLNQIQRAAVARRDAEREIDAPTLPIVEERTPETVLLERERFERLNQAILTLPQEERRLLMMSRIEGLTYAEISARTGRSPADISRRIARSLSTLQSRLNTGSER